jgi:hypothetical protein
MKRCPVVAHIHASYLPLSDTFIHCLVASLQESRPVFLTERVENESALQVGHRSLAGPLSDRAELPLPVFAKAFRLSVPLLSCYCLPLMVSFRGGNASALLQHPLWQASRFAAGSNCRRYVPPVFASPTERREQ